MSDLLPLPVLTSEVVADTITRRQRWIDLCFVIGVTIVPLVVGSFGFVLHPEILGFAGTRTQSFQHITLSLGGVAILFYVLWKRGEGVHSLGQSPEKMDFLRGVLLFAGVYATAAIAAVVSWMIYKHFSGHQPHSVDFAGVLASRPGLLLWVSLFVNPWFEELIVRGFLMTELTRLTNVTVAVVASTVIQASYHTYQGSWSMVQFVPVFLVLSIYYAKTWRLFPVIVAHTLLDYVPVLWRVAHHRGH